MERLLNILLFPKDLYKKLTDNKFFLTVGILIIGLIDIILPDVKGIYIKYFENKPGNILFRNIVIFLALISLIGFIDVFITSLPLRDIFKLFKKEKSLQSDEKDPLIKIMKIYIISHFLIIPINTILYYTVFKGLNEFSNPNLIIFAVFYNYLIMIWSTSIMYRGINVIYSFQPLFKRLVFSVVLLWTYIWGTVLNYIIDMLEKVLLI